MCFFLFGEGVSCVGWCRAGPWCALGGLLGCCSLLFVFARCERCAWCVFVGWRVRVGVSGECGCLGAGCVVRGGVLPSWLGDAVAGGGVSVGFDVGDRVLTLGGVSAPVSGSSPVSGSVSVSGSVVPVSPDAGVGASGSSGGVRVCVPCARAVFGVSWCSLVLRRWARAAGVDGVRVDALLGSASGSGSVRSVASGGGGRVGAGFGARVRDWGACVGVGGGVVSGGDVVSGWWAGWRSRVGGLASSVGVKGLVLAGLVGVVVLVSVVVLVG